MDPSISAIIQTATQPGWSIATVVVVLFKAYYWYSKFEHE
jgi:hypothetical protein